MVLDGLPITLLGEIILKNKYFVVIWVVIYFTLYMKIFLGCQNTLIAYIEFFLLPILQQHYTNALTLQPE